MATTQMTICTKCRWHRNTHEGRQAGPPPGMWYYQICTNPDVERLSTVDHVSGETVFMDLGGHGKTTLTKKEYPFCRDINDGECRLFQESSQS